MSDISFVPENELSGADTLQPTMTFEAIQDPQTEVDAPKLLHDIRQIVVYWAEHREDLPDFFSEEFRIDRVTREPVFILSFEVQTVRRSREAYTEPYRGGPIDRSAWRVHDLFQLVPCDTCVFPSFPTEERLPVKGQQKQIRCAKCSATGLLTCTSCGGQGGHVCEACSGVGHGLCTACEGAGTVIGRNSRLISCINCSGTGSSQCTGCSGNGHIDCQDCQASGSISCDDCDSTGQLIQSWQIINRAKTSSSYRYLGSAPDELLPADLMVGAGCISSEVVDLLVDENWQQRINASVPKQINWIATEEARKAMEVATVHTDAHSRATGIRMGVWGTYLYRIELEHLGQSGVLYLSGKTNSITVRQLPARPMHFAARFLRSMDRFFSMFGMGAQERPDEAYSKGVQENQVHVVDRKRLISELKSFGVKAELIDHEYRVYVHESSLDNLSIRCSLRIRFGADRKGRSLIITSCDLGRASRELFPAALEMSQQLDFGHIALVEDPQTKEERFELLDCRHYENLTPGEYYLILRSMSSDYQDLVENLC